VATNEKLAFILGESEAEIKAEVRASVEGAVRPVSKWNRAFRLSRFAVTAISVETVT
jgi:hypothetical protein